MTETEAFVLTADNAYDLEQWCDGKYLPPKTVESQGIITGQRVIRSEQIDTIPGHLLVPTPKGPKPARIGDRIVRRPDGTFDVEPALPP